MSYLSSLAKTLQSLLEIGSIVPARLRNRLDEPTAQKVEQAIRALAEVAMQQHHHGLTMPIDPTTEERHNLLLSEIAIHARAVRTDLFLNPQEAVRRILVIIGFSRTVLDADARLEEQLGPNVGGFFEELDRVQFGDRAG
ncbi:MAG: hypothetical protein U0236_23620 [Nitrospira sp.]